MGASLSLDAKYVLSLTPSVFVELESNTRISSKSYESGSGSGSESDREGDHVNDSGSGSESDSDNSESSNQEGKNEVKINRDIVANIKSYIRTKDFLEKLDEITEVELESEGFPPKSLVVFDATKVVYDDETDKVIVHGKWTYTVPRMNKKKSSKDSCRSHHHHGEDTNDGNKESEYKTSDDEISSRFVLDAVRERLREYSESQEFYMSKSKRLFIEFTNVDMEEDE
jgi:hypothetical protein